MLARFNLLLFVIALTSSVCSRAQSPGDYPARLPYSFSNFVWWNDAELRLALKGRMPELGDEIPTTSAAIGRMRDVLKAVLREKSVVAEIQSEEPSPSALNGQRVQGAPPPSIIFSVLSPKVLIERVIVSGAPDTAQSLLTEEFGSYANRPYSNK